MSAMKGSTKLRCNLGPLGVMFGVMISCLGLATAQTDACIDNLRELHQRMEAESSDVLVYENATRSAPYRYVLCPNTLYVYDGAESQIQPYLDLTYIMCGDNGLLENNCTIKYRAPKGDGTIVPTVLLRQNFGSYSRYLTVLSGIKFDESVGASVAAWDVYPTRVILRKCHWMMSRGLTIVHNQVPLPEKPTVGEEAMIVQLDDCVIESKTNPKENFDRANAPLNMALFSMGGTLQINNITFRNNKLNYFIFASFARCTVRNSLFVGNLVEEGIFGSKSVLDVSTTRFEENKYITGSLSVADAAVTSRFNEFIGNSGLADITTLSMIRGTSTVYCEVVSSCFTDGNYISGPVLNAGMGLYTFEDVFVASTSSGECPFQPFLEKEDELCFDNDGFFIEDKSCQGECDVDVIFDADICALAPKPSAAPSTSPKPSTSFAPTTSPTLSSAPTPHPSEKPTYLSMVYSQPSEKYFSNPPTPVAVLMDTQPDEDVTRLSDEEQGDLTADDYRARK